jgi:hypothetical protein
MTRTIPAGPYRTLTTIEGDSFPYYIIPFDKNGGSEGPRTQQHLLDNLEGYSDIFVFSHGWNNDWSTAVKRYEDFIKGFQSQRKRLGLKMGPGYKPLLVGIFWPSQAMEWFESETGPGFAAADPDAYDASVAESKALAEDIAAELPAGNRRRFFELVQGDSLEEAEARELAEMLAALKPADDEGVHPGAPSSQDLLAAASTIAVEEPDYEEVGTVGSTSPAAEAPKAAFGLGGMFKALDPRSLIKPFTVYRMKDRAGKVGLKGVTPMLQGLLGLSRARVHVVGHSYGCKLLMTAVCALPDGMRKLHSALLLQPAVSQYAFAENVPERPGQPGGFRRGLGRVSLPIVSTFSSNDVPLTRMYHMALRRYGDLGEQPDAAGAPSIYGALGGFGPQDSDETIFDIKDENQAYDLGKGGRIVGVRGSRTISGHGDINNPSTWWLAYSLATAPSA